MKAHCAINHTTFRNKAQGTENMFIDELAKKFIKTAPDGKADRRSYTVYALTVGLAVHLIMFGVKLATGLLIHSVAVRTDAWNNFAAAAAAGFSISDLLIPQIKGTKAHPISDKARRGIRQAKYIIAFVTAFIVIEIGFSFFSRAFTRLTRPVAVRYGIPAVVVLLLCVALRRWLSVFYIRLVGKTEQDAIPKNVARSVTANALTLLAIVAVILDQFLHINSDFLATLVLSVAVMRAGIGIAFRVIRPAVEERAEPVFLDEVQEQVLKYSIITGAGAVKARFFGPGRRMVSMRVKVPKEGDPAETYGSLRVIEETVGKKCGITLILHADMDQTDEPEELYDPELTDEPEELYGPELTDESENLYGPELTDESDKPYEPEQTEEPKGLHEQEHTAEPEK